MSTIKLIKNILRPTGLSTLVKKIRVRNGIRKQEKNNYRAHKKIRWMGLPWCGFFIDTSLINEEKNLLSFGVGTDISFDLALQKYGIKQIYLFDPTPVSIQFIEKQNLPSNIHFHAWGISDKDEVTSFYLPVDKNRVSASIFQFDHLQNENEIQVTMFSLRFIMEQLKIQQIDILKLDIEGSEFRVLPNIIEEQIFPEQICVEFHGRYFADGGEKVNTCMQLLEKYYSLVASTDGEEYLFVRK